MLRTGCISITGCLVCPALEIIIQDYGRGNLIDHGLFAPGHFFIPESIMALCASTDVNLSSKKIDRDRRDFLAQPIYDRREVTH